MATAAALSNPVVTDPAPGVLQNGLSRQEEGKKKKKTSPDVRGPKISISEFDGGAIAENLRHVLEEGAGQSEEAESGDDETHLRVSSARRKFHTKSTSLPVGAELSGSRESSLYNSSDMSDNEMNHGML